MGRETGLVLPDNIFPAGLPPTSIPLGSFVPNPNNAELAENESHPTTPPRTNDNNLNVSSPQTPLVALPLMPPLGAPPQPPSALGISTAFPLLPMPSVPALNAIPGTVPILLPMPQFTPEQIANLGKLNINIKTSLNQISPQNNKKIESTLKPTVPLFKPAVSKPIKLEDIKEEDEDEEDVDDDIKLRSQCLIVPKPKSRKECMETLKNDLIAEEIDDLDSTVYPATLWCLHVKSFHAAPECSLKKLQQSMASALHCISS